ncbi:hypothetical protein PRIPAC_91598 [Pristionchus pacificus]|uniref:Uncharacterized protein n=1 Tax=Pristionchus pacificus TaxID=54126 RepID=A0A2A6BBQ9_PRIPA|nr:hypothetical protein PRIPAC_91598 [Pristionchus pacificus]|eukprot:PDM63281.1 hypothetical protein PRIPAC_50496 [Pristionchus pacificus]
MDSHKIDLVRLLYPIPHSSLCKLPPLSPLQPYQPLLPLSLLTTTMFALFAWIPLLRSSLSLFIHAGIFSTAFASYDGSNRESIRSLQTSSAACAEEFISPILYPKYLKPLKFSAVRRGKPKGSRKTKNSSSIFMKKSQNWINATTCIYMAAVLAEDAAPVSEIESDTDSVDPSDSTTRTAAKRRMTSEVDAAVPRKRSRI